MSGNRMHHAWLLAGRAGLGKAQFAQRAATAVIGNADHTVPENHPDIITLQTLPASSDEEKKRNEGKPFLRKRSIAVDQIRALQQRLTTRPTLGDRRIIIIDAADDLEKVAANALLKSLEEPPVGSFFILVAHHPARLLPTIRSRCRTIRFSDLSDREVAAVLEQSVPGTDPDKRAAAVAAASGSPGAALDFVDQDLGPLNALMRAIAANGDANLVLRGKLAAAIGTRPDRNRQLASIDLARAVLSANMREAGRADSTALATAHAQLVRLGSQATTYNFDPGLLVMEIGSLLASSAMDRAAA